MVLPKVQNYCTELSPVFRQDDSLSQWIPGISTNHTTDGSVTWKYVLSMWQMSRA